MGRIIDLRGLLLIHIGGWVGGWVWLDVVLASKLTPRALGLWRFGGWEKAEDIS